MCPHPFSRLIRNNNRCTYDNATARLMYAMCAECAILLWESFATHLWTIILCYTSHQVAATRQQHRPSSSATEPAPTSNGSACAQTRRANAHVNAFYLVANENDANILLEPDKHLRAESHRPPANCFRAGWVAWRGRQIYALIEDDGKLRIRLPSAVCLLRANRLVPMYWRACA